jgi:CzcA family heavy metal efflux pump
MKFFKTILNNKVTIYILVFIIVLVGAFSYSSLPRESAPSIKIPFVFITTVYPGVSPNDIESLISQEIEKELKGISGVKEIKSVSRESFSSISVEFNPDIIIDDAIQKVRDKVSTAKTKMPKDIQEPVISEINFSELPMLYINLTGNIGLSKLKDIADKISDNIETIPGILSADVIGGLENEVKVNVDANRLKYYNLSLNDITNTISAENINIPGGGVNIGESKYLIRIPGEIEDPLKVSDLIIKTPGGAPIYIRDVAQVIYGYKERNTYSRNNGKESVTIVIKKRSGSNIVGIADQIKSQLEESKKTLPQGVGITLTGDESKRIKTTVHELENGIITGVVLVCVILFFFMGLKNSMLVATSIPLSFLIAFSVLSVLGVNLNIVVLFGLILVLGIIVDDAIVVIENIYRLQEKEGFTPYDAAIEGPREVAFPVSIATLTIIASFFPLLFFPGIVGEFMKFLPITLIVCLLSSLFVAMVISPVQAAVFINYKKDKLKAERKKFRPVSRFLEWFDKRLFGVILTSYEKALRKGLIKRKTVIGITILLLIFTFIIYGKFNKGVEFFPNVEPRQASVNVTTPIGSSVDKTNDLTKKIETKLPQYSDIEYYVSNVGSSNNPLDFSGEGIPNKSTITLNFKDKHEREHSSFQTIEEVREAISKIAGGEIRIEKQASGPPTGPPVNLEIAGDDFLKLGEISENIIKEIKDIPGLKDLRSDFDKARPEIKILVNREKAALYKLSTALIGSTIRTAVNGTGASKYRVGENEYDITVRLDKNQRDNLDNVQNLYINNPDGIKIPLTSVAVIDISGGISAINRKDLKRVVTISANAEGRLPNEVIIDIKKKLSGFKLPDGYKMTYTGEQQAQQESSTFLLKAFGISLILVFMLIVIEFNSVRTPLIIMFSVLLSLIGVLSGLLITGTPFGIVMTGIGVISLAGIVVRNAIVLLDFQKELVSRGIPRDEALVQAGVIRLRPVFLTAAATILGIIPLATGVDFDWRSFSWVVGGENTAFWRPMGIAIIFGLSIATFLTLLVVPVIFSFTDDLLLKIKNKFRRNTEKDLETGLRGEVITAE